MSMALVQDAHTETYEDLKQMIFDLANRFCRRYRFEFDEAVSIANKAFCESFEPYDPSRAAFPTYVYQRINSQLFEAHRTLMRRKILGRIVDADPDLIASNDSACFVTDLLDMLSADARTVVELTLDSPKEVVHCILDKGSTPRNIRAALREFLRDSGWTAARITESFNEIGDALQ